MSVYMREKIKVQSPDGEYDIHDASEIDYILSTDDELHHRYPFTCNNWKHMLVYPAPPPVLSSHHAPLYDLDMIPTLSCTRRFLDILHYLSMLYIANDDTWISYTDVTGDI